MRRREILDHYLNQKSDFFLVWSSVQLIVLFYEIQDWNADHGVMTDRRKVTIPGLLVHFFDAVLHYLVRRCLVVRKKCYKTVREMMVVAH